MKKFSLLHLIFAGLFLVFSFSAAKAQNRMQQQTDENLQTDESRRPNLLRELGLTPDQIGQLRRLNQEYQPVLRESQRRLRDAKKALDEAIYADRDNEAEIQSRLREVQSAQMEVIKNRTLTERAVRRILTPQQLTKFRNLRGQFMQKNNRPERLRQRRLERRQNRQQNQ